MDVFVKSFNRPYYLDRCLYSINKYFQGFKGNVYVLDDGTPEYYLDKIKQKYPSVSILKSDLYAYKSKNLNNTLSREIPIDFWITSVKKSSDYFLLLEDDIWFVNELNANGLQEILEKNKVDFLKLFWLGNPKLTSKNISKKEQLFNIVKPKLLTKHPLLYRLVFRAYRYKLPLIMKVLGLNSKENKLGYYSIYSVAGVIFKKDYFIKLWDNHNQSVDESLQLMNALKYFKENPQSQVAHANKEFLKAGFSTAATPSSKKYKDVNIDLYYCNKVLNDAWFNDDFDVLKDFPNDFNPNEITRILNIAEPNGNLAKEWQKWTQSFRNQYLKFGCDV